MRRLAIGIGLAAASVAAGGVLAVTSGVTSGSAGLGPPAHPSGSASAGTDDGAASALSMPLRQPAATDPASGKASGGNAAVAAPPHLVVPDVIATVPGGVNRGDLAKLRKIGQVRGVLPVAGGRVTVNGKPVTVLGAPAAKLRAWMPPPAAGSQRLWTGFAAGDLVTTPSAARSAGLRAGSAYPVRAGVSARVRFGASAPLGITGVGGIVDDAQAKRLGLVRNVAVLVNAPAADMLTLTGRVRAALGKGSRAVRLVPASAGTSLPVDPRVSSGVPANYLQLYQESAARYCPGLSWTVLAAIGQIESGDGANLGPSTAGALGPMQFLPSTWKIWGMTGFGQAGPPNIMDPLDAVPSAARMLCANGAAAGGQRLRQAIFDYNHATWYVDEVLTLANEYATEFGGS